MDRTRLTGVALALLSSASFGVMPVLTKAVYDDGVGPLGVLSVRFSLAALLLLALARLRGEALPRGRGLVALLLLGGVGYVAEALFYFSALERISASLTSLLLYTYPPMVVLLTALLARRAPRPVAVACVLAATVGTALTIGRVEGGQRSGVVLGVAAAVTYAVYIVVSGRVAPRTGPLATSAVVMGGAAVVYDILAVGAQTRLPHSVGAWSALVAVALVSTVVAVTAFFAALPRLGASDIAVVSTAEPVVAVGSAAVVLGERLGPLQVAGGVLVLLAVVVLARLAPPAEPDVVPV
ncbi:MAG: protein of unknown function transrane [Frankiales bacterium]|nr:protein of unknown function transrane [Frankiales bacterium]